MFQRLQEAENFIGFDSICIDSTYAERAVHNISHELYMNMAYECSALNEHFDRILGCHSI